MNKDQQDLYLTLFIRHVEDGKTPPAYLMEFMADGARNFLRDGKPWVTKEGRKGEFQKAERRKMALSAYALKRIECNRARIKDLAGYFATEFSDDTFNRDINKAQAIASSESGRFEYQWALTDLLEHSDLKPDERKALLELKNHLDIEDDLLNKEPIY